MATVVNNGGQLWKRTKITSTHSEEYDGYELLEDSSIPTLEYPTKIDARVVITVDGRLYDTHRFEYIDSNISNFIQVISSLIYREVSIALTADNHAYLIKLSEGYNEVILISDNVELVTSSNSHFIIKSDGKWNIIFDDDINEYLLDVDVAIDKRFDVNDIVYNSNGLIVTHDYIYSPVIIGRWDELTIELEMIKRSSNHTIVGIINRVDQFHNDRKIVIIDIIDDRIECYIVTITNNRREYTYTTVVNADEVLGEDSWVGFVQLGVEDVLLSRTGDTYYVSLDHNIMRLTPTKVPYWILESKVMIKSAMSDVRYSD